jgi:hypothetical protein
MRKSGCLPGTSWERSHDCQKQTTPIIKPALRPTQQSTENDRYRLAKIDISVASLDDRRGLKLMSPDLDSGWSRFSASSLRRAVAHHTFAPHRGDTQAYGRLAVEPQQAAWRIFIVA